MPKFGTLDSFWYGEIPIRPEYEKAEELTWGVMRMHHAVMPTSQPLSLSYFVPTGSRGLSLTGPLPQREWVVVSVIHDAYGTSLRNPLLSAEKPDS